MDNISFIMVYGRIKITQISSDLSFSFHFFFCLIGEFCFDSMPFHSFLFRMNNEEEKKMNSCAKHNYFISFKTRAFATNYKQIPFEAIIVFLCLSVYFCYCCCHRFHYLMFANTFNGKYPKWIFTCKKLSHRQINVLDAVASL